MISLEKCGSRNSTVIASEAKQLTNEVWIASSLALLAMTVTNGN